MNNLNWRTVVLVTMLVGSAWWLGGAENPKHSLPEPLTRTLNQLFPDHQIVDTDRDEEDGEIEYRVRMKLPPDNRGASLEFGTEAGLTSIEEQLRQEQLPKRLQNALRKHFPNAKFRDAHKESETRVTYKIELITDGKRRDVTFSPRGRVLEVEKRD